MLRIQRVVQFIRDYGWSVEKCLHAFRIGCNIILLEAALYTLFHPLFSLPYHIYTMFKALQSGGMEEQVSKTFKSRCDNVWSSPNNQQVGSIDWRFVELMSTFKALQMGGMEEQVSRASVATFLNPMLERA